MHSLAEGLATGMEQLPGTQANRIPDSWTHITKLDPEPLRRVPLLYPQYLAHTSAISVGGSTDVTSENTSETFQLLRRIDSPILHEPSAPSHVTERTRAQADFLVIPEVLNGSSDAFIGTLGAGVESLRSELVPSILETKLPKWLVGKFTPWVNNVIAAVILDRAIFEAYIIQNPDSAAAREAGVSKSEILSPDEARHHAIGADSHLNSEVVYIEYSGTYGGEEATSVIKAISSELNWSKLWYGGGLASRDQVRDITEAGVDGVVVGNAFHEIAREQESFYEELKTDRSLSEQPRFDEIDDWVTNSVDIPDTAGARYLSTTSVPSYIDTARRLLAETLFVYGCYEHILTEYSTGSPQEHRETLLNEFPRCRQALQPVSEQYIENLFTHLRTRTSGETTESPLRHVALPERI